MKLTIEEIRDQLLSENHTFLESAYLKNSSFCIQNLRRKFNISEEDGEDIFSESILILRKNILQNRLQNIDQLRNYLFTICCNLASSNKRKERRNRTLSLEESPQDIEDESSQKLSDKTQFEKRLSMVEEGFKQLSEKCKQMLLYYYRDNISHKLIAERVGYTSENVAKNAKHRCLQKLMEAI